MKRRLIATVLTIVLFSVSLSFSNAAAAVEIDLPETLSDAIYRMQSLKEQLSDMVTSAIEESVNKFEDMKNHWSRQVVGKLSDLGIISGYDGKFWPGNPVQADQFIKMTVMAMGYKIEQGKDYWAQPYIDTALREGIVEKGEFADYTKPLTREQMARIAVRTVLKLEDEPDSQNEQYIISKISDFMYIESEYKQYVLNGYKLGLFQGSNGKFHPKNTLTRAEAATVIIRILDNTEKKPTKPASEEDRFPWEINYPSEEELARMYKNPAIPERLYTRLADTDEGQINILKSHHKFICRSGEKEAEEWAAFAKSYMETMNNINYSNIPSDFKDKLIGHFSPTATTNYNGMNGLSMQQFVDEYVKDFIANNIIQEAKFETDPSLVYYGGQYGAYRVRGTLYFRFSEPSSQEWLWPGSTVGKWYQMDMEIDFYYTTNNTHAVDREIYLEVSKLMEDNVYVEKQD